MTVLAGDFRDVGHNIVHGTVTLSAPFTRPSSSRPNEVVTRKLLTIALVDGGFVSPELDPGPLIVEVRGDGVYDRWEVDLPETGRHELVSLLETRLVYEPSVVGRVDAAATSASKSATAAGKSATAAAEAERRVQAIVVGSADALREELEGTIHTVEVARSEVAQARREIAAARAAAEEVGGNVTAARDRAEGAASRAEGAATDAANRVQSNLNGIRQQVAQDAAQAHRDAGAAEESKTGADNSKQAAQEAAERASAHATDARNAAARTAADRRQTGKDRDAAAASAAEARQAAASAKVGAPETGWARNTLSTDVRDSLSRADSALQSLPQATPSAAGAIRLAGDLAGTADAPRVQGVLREQDATDAVQNGKVVRRTNTGHVLLPEQTTGLPPQAAVSKAYLDERLVPKGWQTHDCELWDNARIDLNGGTEKYTWTQYANGDIRLVGMISVSSGVTSTGGRAVCIKNLPGRPLMPSGAYVMGHADMYLAGDGGGRLNATAYLQGDQIRFLVPSAVGSTSQSTFQLWDGSNRVGTGFPRTTGDQMNLLRFIRFDITYPSR